MLRQKRSKRPQCYAKHRATTCHLLTANLTSVDSTEDLDPSFARGSPNTPDFEERTARALAGLAATEPRTARDSFRRLRDLAEADWPRFVGSLRFYLSGGETSSLVQWAALELAFGARLQSAARNRYAELSAMVSPPIADLADELYRSPHLAAPNLVAEFRTGLRKRLRKGEAMTSPFLPFAGADKALPGRNRDGWLRLESTIAVLRHAGAPLAAEYFTRLDLVRLSELSSSVSYKEIASYRLGLAFLRKILGLAKGDRGVEPPETLWSIAEEIVGRIGRRLEVWASLDKARVDLIRGVPAHAASRRRWAWSVAATWARTDEAMAAVRALSPAEAELLHEVAESLDASGLAALAGSVLAGAMKDALVTTTSDVQEGRKKSPVQNWTVIPKDQLPVIIQAIDEWDRPTIMSRWPLEELQGFAPTVLVSGMVHFARRLEEDCYDREVKRVAMQRRALWSTTDAWERSLLTHREELGWVLPDVDEALPRVVRVLRTLADGLPWPSPVLRRKAEPILPSPATTEQITGSLTTLSVTSLQDPEAGDRLRASLLGHLLAAATDQEALAGILARLSEYPPESTILLWRVGILAETPALVDTALPYLTRREGWAQRALAAIVLESLPSSVLFPGSTGTAEALLECLSRHVAAMWASSVDRLAGLDATVLGEIERASSALREATGRYAHALQGLDQTLRQKNADSTRD